jgi:hypothetical protein
MKCFYHPETDGVGLCSECGKAACRDCIEDVGQTMLCKGCLAVAARGLRREEQKAEIDRARLVERARRRVRTSWIVAAVVAIPMGLMMAIGIVSDPHGPADVPPLLLLIPMTILGTGYVVWSFYWGMPAVWNWWRGIFKNVGCFLIANPFTWLIVLVFFFWVPFMAAIYYAPFGGGIYQFFKWRRIAAGGMVPVGGGVASLPSRGYCTQCGSQLRDAAAFCSQCGQPTTAEIE